MKKKKKTKSQKEIFGMVSHPKINYWGMADPRVLMVVRQLPLVDGGGSNPQNRLLGVAKPQYQLKGIAEPPPMRSPPQTFFILFYFFIFIIFLFEGFIRTVKEMPKFVQRYHFIIEA
jgi:hypothetical protein